MILAELRQLPSHAADPVTKSRLMLSGLNELTAHHYAACEPYRRIIDGLWHKLAALDAPRLAAVPYLPVSLFKQQSLASVPTDDITLTLTSSGTTGQAVSRIFVDRETSSEQQRCLANSMQHVLGTKRLPMLVADTAAVLKDPALMSARGAGVLGMMRFGYRPFFLMDENGQPDEQALDTFLAAHGKSPFFIFGFTFMIWTQLVRRFADLHPDLSQGILVHSGGWKKLQEQAVDNDTFRGELARSFGLTKVFNFYGMVEQIGSLFIEGTGGLLYPPNFSDVIIRDPISWQPVPPGQPGLIQVLSLIPRSYPGHSLLTEDIGVLEFAKMSGSAPARPGLRILGRVAKAELRGCSDVIATQNEAAASEKVT